MTHDPDTDSTGRDVLEERDGASESGQGAQRARGAHPDRLRHGEPLRSLDLCAGIGGVTLGLERAGIRAKLLVEIDPFCQRVLAKHWPDVPQHDDIKTLHVRPGEYEVLAAGFPCQPASLAGRRQGVDDDRWLWPDVARLVGEAQPRWVLLENVRGLCSKGLPEVLADLAGLGYDAEWQIVSAAALGAPHIRERIFVIAYPQREQLRQQPRGSGGTDGQDPAQPPVDGLRRLVADTDSTRRHLGPGDIPPPGRGHELEDGRTDVADPCRAGRDAEGLHPRVYVEAPGGGPLRAAPRADELARAWAVEPDVGRVAHGVPSRLDRLRVLGNAVVPQVAEFVGRIILDAERER